MLSVISLRRKVGPGLLLLAAALSLVWFAPKAFAESESESEPEQESSSDFSNWYVSAILSGRDGYRVTHYWSRGSTVRAQTLVGIHPVITIVRGDRYWAYDELGKEGIEIKRSPLALAEAAKGMRPFANDLKDLIRANGEKVETGLLSGVPAETWRVTNEAGRRTVWVTVGEPRVPLRVENFNRETGDSATLNYSNWASGFDLPASAFEPPADVRFEKYEYDEYLEKSLKGFVGPVPIFHPKLLHGPRPR